MEKNEKLVDRAVNWMRYSISLKFIVIGVLTLLLLIPLEFIKELISERKFRQIEMIEEVNDKWGREVFVYGPMLQIPYVTYSKVQKTNPVTKEITIEKIEELKTFYIFPDELQISGNITPLKKNRGIYNSVVFNEESKMQGGFKTQLEEIQDISNDDIIWDQAKIILKISNLKGIKEKVNIRINGKSYEFHPNFSQTKTLSNDLDRVYVKSLETPQLQLTDSAIINGVSFTIDLNINGSEKIRYIPVGKTTTLNLTSTWKDPSFIGHFLPYNEDKITDNGFNAKWKILNINRGFGQIHYNSLPNLMEYGFGVELMIAVDEYLQSERSAKYGYLVIVLTFLVFFLIQIVSKIEMHFFQYILIGLALAIFYILLVSISEHSNFFISYLISGVSVITLISFYSKGIFKYSKFTYLIAISLSVLYGFIFVIIQLDNYALLVGSIGLFAILATIMYFTRKIEWNLAPKS